MSTSTAVRPVPKQSSMTLHDKFQRMITELNGEVLEAEERILGAMVALIAGLHMAMVGAPGTAKTYLVDRIMLRISGARFYSELMRLTMSPDLVYGSQSINAMKNDEPVRFVTTGMLPEADVALIDEFTRTSDAIANGMLTILNERRFKNGGATLPVPLHTAFLCANSLPVGDTEHDLEAFWDRVVMRFIVELPKDRATWRAIGRLRPDTNPDVLLDWSEVLLAHAESQALPITDEAFDAIDEIRVRLDGIGIKMSPRRMRQAQYVAAATAWLAGADEVQAEHCDMLMHMLWEVPEQQREVEKIVVDVCAPGQKAAVELADAAEKIGEKIREVIAMPLTDASRANEVNELFDKSGLLRDELDDLLATATGRALRTVEAASKAHDANHIRLVTEGLQLSPKQLRQLRK